MEQLNNDPFRALYIHVPFCVKRCTYCDFHTQALPANSPAIRAWLDRMLLAIRKAGKAGALSAVETIYMGGGTPSYLGNANLTELLYMLGISMHLDGVEFSMEANPDSLDVRMVRDMWAMGVNRLSIGVQSFDNAVLRTLGRVHSADAAKRAIEAAHERFENVSVDVMCGVPGQSTESVVESIEVALGLGVTHISVYPLMVEEGTPLEAYIDQGAIAQPTEDAAADAMEAAEEVLTRAGFARYEVASYARPGYECKHNCAYWTGVPYLGLSEGSVTMEQGRWGRRRIREEKDGVRTTEEELSPTQAAAEDIMLGMRMTAGVPESLIATHAHDYFPELPKVLETLVQRGLLEHTDNTWRPTHTGWLCGNQLYAELLSLAP